METDDRRARFVPGGDQGNRSSKLARAQAGEAGEPRVEPSAAVRTNAGASDMSQPMVVNLVGDIHVDGRQLGRLTASSQAREASLPASGPSRVNLRTIPVYTGTRISR